MSGAGGIDLDPTRVFPFRRARAEARLPLFCFPFAGGSAAMFRGWAARFADAVDVVPVELPGRGTRHREAPVSAFDGIVTGIATAMAPFTTRPYAIYGHSMGGLLGFEVARVLVAAGCRAPVRLVVSGSRAPQVPNPNAPIHHYDDDDFLRALERYGGIPSAVWQSPELLRHLLPLVRADFTAYECHRYVPGPPVSWPISAFGGVDDPWVRRAVIEPWAALTTAGFAFTLLPGGHFFLRTAEAELLAHIVRALAWPP